MATELSAKEMAIKLGTDARTLRKFLRDVTPIEDQPGQGGRWTFTAAQVTKLKKKFDSWGSTKAEARAAAASKKASKVEEAEDLEELEEVVDDEDEDLDDIDEPADEDLEEIEDEDDDIDEI